jgi:multicomponent Na+:H+ antiporter subunit B
MSTRRAVRLYGFLASVVVLVGLLAWGVAGLPAFGHFAGRYGQILNHVTVAERHVTNVVGAIVFDYRGLDTMGEEFILFASVIAVALLFREVRDDVAHRPTDSVRSDAVRAVGTLMVAPTVLLGLYIIAQGYLTPGGGFQGGVACAAGLALVYAAGQYRAYRAASPIPLLEFGEGLGVGAYVAIGMAAVVAGFPFLANFVGLGTAGELHAGGTIPLLNWAVGLEVSAALVLLFHEFLEELMDPTSPGGYRP